MHAAALIAALLFAASGAAPLPVVCEDVEMVSVAHVSDGAELVFYWSQVQSDWTCLDHRWVASDMTIRWDGDAWAISWLDEETCHRIVRTKRWVESWEQQSPLADQQNRPWFRRMLCPGLKQPPKLAQAN